MLEKIRSQKPEARSQNGNKLIFIRAFCFWLLHAYRSLPLAVLCVRKTLDIANRISYSWVTFEQIEPAALEGGFAILGYAGLPELGEVSCAKK